MSTLNATSPTPNTIKLSWTPASGFNANQWLIYRDGVDVTSVGGSIRSFSMNGVSAGSHTVEVKGKRKNHFDPSNVVTLVVSNPTPVPTPAPPVITVQPVSQTVAAGGSVVFSVSATGTAPLDFQWRFNGVNIVGATGTFYSLSGVQGNQAGNYSVAVHNAAGTVNSVNAVLTVSATPPPPPINPLPTLRETVLFPVSSRLQGGVLTASPALPLKGDPFFEFAGDTWVMLSNTITNEFQGDAFNLRDHTKRIDFTMPDPSSSTGVFHFCRNGGPVWVFPTAGGFIIAKGNQNAPPNTPLSLLGPHFYVTDPTGKYLAGGNLSQTTLLLDAKRFGDAVYVLYGRTRMEDPEPRTADIYLTRISTMTNAVITRHYTLPAGDSSNLPPMIGSFAMLDGDLTAHICRDSNHVDDVIQIDAATLALKKFWMKWIEVGNDLPVAELCQFAGGAILTLTAPPFMPVPQFLEQIPGVRLVSSLTTIGAPVWIPDTYMVNATKIPVTVNSAGNPVLLIYANTPTTNVSHFTATRAELWRWTGTGFDRITSETIKPCLAQAFIDGAVHKDWLTCIGIDGGGYAKRFS